MAKKFEPKKMKGLSSYEESLNTGSVIASIKQENAKLVNTSMRIRADFKKELEIYAAMNGLRGFANVIASILEKFTNSDTGDFDRSKLEEFLKD